MPLFGAAHLGILGAILALASAFSAALRKWPDCTRPIRYSLAGFLLVNELIWYAYRLQTEGFRFPHGLPLQLCDLVLWLTVIAAFRLHPLTYEVAYYGGLGGSAIALLTPDLWAPFPSYPTIYFFLSHGFVVITLAALAGGRVIRPRTDSLWRAYGLLNLYTVAVGIFNFCFGTNYMYLRIKPAGASLLDYFGPWPGYVLVGDVFALGIFCLLWLPHRRADRMS